jgi:hypothetical protein
MPWLSSSVRGLITLVTPETGAASTSRVTQLYKHGQDHEFANARAN